MKSLFKKNTSTGVAHFIKKAVIFLLILYVVDFCAGSIFKAMFHKQRTGWEYRTKYSIEDTKENILIFGSSRAQQQYNPTFFEERLHQPCYNVGRDGESMLYHYAVLQGVLKRYTPNIIILECDNGMFNKVKNSYERLSTLLPYYRDHPELRPIIQLRGPYEKFKLLSRIYPYNSLMFKIASGTISKYEEDIKGYVPLTRSLHEPIRPVALSNKYELDTVKVNYFKLFIKDCKTAGAKLYLVRSPYFMKVTGEDHSIIVAKDIAKQNNLHFIDISKDTYFSSNSNLFDDTVHVNMNGAKIFNNQLIDTLIKYEGISN